MALVSSAPDHKLLYIEMMKNNLNLPFRNTVTFVDKNATDVVSDFGTGKQVFATQTYEDFWAGKN